MGEYIDALQKWGSKSRAAKQLGIDRSTFRYRYDREVMELAQEGKEPPKPPPMPRKEPSLASDSGCLSDETNSSGRRNIDSYSVRVKTLEGLLEDREVDLGKWRVARHVLNQWEVGARHPKTGEILVEPLYQVKAWLEPLDPVETGFVQAMEKVIETIGDHSPAYPKQPPQKLTGNMLEIALYDVHVAKLGWGREVGEDSDLEITEEDIGKAVHGLISRADGYEYEKILLPIGQDYFHVNSAEMQTEKGTPQDVDGRFEKMFEVGIRSMVNVIDVLQKVAPVEMIWVPGNHDRHTSWFLAKYLEAHYRKNDRVSVDCEPTKRKYRVWGPCLLGFTHGDQIRPDNLPGTMAIEVPDLWAMAKHREWHTGHLHKRKGVSYTFADTLHSVTVRILPSIAGADAWHYQKGFIGNDKAAEAYIWNKESGYIGHFNIDLEKRLRAHGVDQNEVNAG